MTDGSASGRHLVLVGLMGVGKTTVGQRCAELLDRPFVDTDDLVVAAAGMPVDEIFARLGEDEFRALERGAVADVAASPTPLVISCGGGAVLDAANRRVLRASGVVVWLTAPSTELASRIGPDRSRPLLARGDATTTLERLSTLREPAYDAAAHARVDTAGRTPDDVATVVLEEYRAWNG